MTEKQPSTIRSIALPAQHGGWGFLIEPILLGLLVAPSWAGLLLSIAAFGAFLIQRPLMIVIKDLRRKRRFERTRIAFRLSLLFGAITLVFSALAAMSAGLVFAPPLAAALPLALIQLGYEARNQGRRLVPEIAGALALGVTASLIALAAHAPMTTALLLWLLIGLRTVPSILYVRARLQWKHGRKPDRVVPLAAHSLAFAFGLLLGLTGAISPLYALAPGLLLARALVGLQERAQSTSARTIGFQEIAFGLLYAVITAAALV